MAEDFGSEKIWSAANLFLFSNVVIDSQTEIGKFGNAAFQQNITKFDIAMN